MPTTPEKNKRKLPFAETPVEDRKILAACLAIAFVFWLLVKLSKEYTVTQAWTITYELPDGKTFALAPPRAFSATVQSEGWNFLQSAVTGKSQQLRFRVSDDASYAISTYRVRTDVERQLGDRDLKVLNITFSDFSSALVLQERKRLPVYVPHALTFAPEHDLKSGIQIQPDSVWVSGPTNLLAGLTAWSTDSLVQNDLSQSLNVTLNLRQPSPELRLNTSTVTVDLVVERYTEKSIFVPIEVVSTTEDSIVFFPDKATLKCVLSLSDFNRPTAADFRLIADLTQQPIENGKTTVALELVQEPGYLHSYSIHPRAVEFFVYQQLATPSENQ
ncbi:MAG: hypothetical protein AAGJ82_12905 [Bacteroidota bacterium]